MIFRINLLIFILLQGIALSATLKDINHKGIKIPIIYEQYNSLPIFNLQLVFKNSGYIADNKKFGLTNLTSKLLNEGTLKDGSVKFARKLESKAISIHSENGFETFVIEVSCLKSEYKKALKFLNSLLKDPNLSNKTLEKLKLMQISSLKQKENDFDYIASKELKSIIFKNTPLEYSSAGDINSINKISIDDIKSNIKNLLNLNNLIIVVGGDIKLDKIKKKLVPILDNLSNTNTLSSTSIFNATKKPTTKIIEKDTKQSYIYFGSPFYIDFNSTDAYKAKVASFILGGSGFGSRLMEEIRVKRGLAYSAYGQIINFRTRSYFTGHLQTKLENTQEAKNLVQSLVDEFIKSGITKDELESAKKFLLGSEPLRTETFSQRQSRAFNLYYKGYSLNYSAQELKLINNLTVDSLNTFIAKHSELSKLSFSIVTHTTKKEK
jgi:predicted Zn-dependent peptidase